MFRAYDFKRKLHEGVTIGSWVTLAHTAIGEIMADADFDWLTVDLEHSVIDLDDLQPLVQVIQMSGRPVLVRLSSNDVVLIKRVLDAGANGIIVPSVNSADAAAGAVRAAKYPPDGERGVGLARAQGYGPGFATYAGSINDEVVIFAIIEHREAVQQIDRIFATRGLDGFMIGPYDLSASYGLPGQLQHPVVLEAQRTVLKAGVDAGIVPGIHVVHGSPAEAQERIAEGFRFIALGVDFLFLGDSCRAALAETRRLAGKAR